MTKVNQAFANAVTSTAFNLSLSRNMIMRLVEIKVRQPGHFTDVFRAAGVTDSSYESGQALLRRGLVEAKNPRYPGHYTLTEAGELVHQLLIMAGLTKPIEDYVKASEKYIGDFLEHEEEEADG